MDKPQRLGCGDGQRCRWLALTGQDVEDDVAADGAASDRLGAGGLDRIKSIGRYRAQDGDHLAVAIGMAAETSPDPLDRGRKRPVLERRAVAQRAGFPRQHKYVMPRIINRLVAPEPTNMLADDRAVLADDDPIGIGMDLNRSSDRCGMHRVFVVIEPHQQRLRH